MIHFILVDSSICIDIEPANEILILMTYSESHHLNMHAQLSLAGPGLIFYMSLHPLYILKDFKNAALG